MSQSRDPDADARTALRLIGPDPANWVPDRAGIDHNVAIIGGGQTGCALAFALRRAGIGKVTILEAAPDEQRAGIWLNAARMNLLRTPKTLPGPELGIPAFSFQAWYEARHGQDAYAAIDRIKRTDWADYLSWYKQFLGINPRYGTRVDRIEPHGRPFPAAPRHARRCCRRDRAQDHSRDGIRRQRRQLHPGRADQESAAHALRAYRGCDRFRRFARQGRRCHRRGGLRLRCGRRGVGTWRRRGSSVRPTRHDRGRTDHALPRFPGAYDNYHQLPDADRWHQAIRFFRCWLDAHDRCDRTHRQIPQFPSASFRAVDNATQNATAR